MSATITRDADSIQATLSNGLCAYYWEDQDKWAVQVENAPWGDGLVVFHGYSGLDAAEAFAAAWDEKAAATCKRAGITPEQWWIVARGFISEQPGT